ncbi:MAG: hypothetical protein IID18_07845 [Nitrospinae bacterium]|nr:hypothetical protein [Nitrospinota bacterium]
MTFSNSTKWITAAVLALAIGTLGKVYWNASSELKQGADAFAQNEYAEAVTHYERSIQWFLPGTGLQDRAAEGFWKTAEHYEKAGEVQNAIDAYRLLRSAFYSTRSFYTPGSDWIVRCNEKIADLTSRLPASAPAEKNKSFEQRKAEALSILNAPAPPHTGWAFLGVTAFFGWIACAALFIFKGMTRSGGLQTRPGIFWGSGFLIFYSLWVLGMANA